MARDELKSNLTKGALGLAVTAGAIAAGIALSDSDNRTKLQRSAKKARKRLGKAAARMAEGYPEYRDRFMATAHTVRRAVKRKSTKALKAPKSKRGRAKK